MKQGMPQKIKDKMKRCSKSVLLPLLFGVGSHFATQCIIIPELRELEKDKKTFLINNDRLSAKELFSNAQYDQSSKEWFYVKNSDTVNLSNMASEKISELRDKISDKRPNLKIDTVYAKSVDDFPKTLGTYNTDKNLQTRVLVLADTALAEKERDVIQYEANFAINSDSMHIDVHEYKHYLNVLSGSEDKDMSFEETYILQYHDEISARIAEGFSEDFNCSKDKNGKLLFTGSPGNIREINGRMVVSHVFDSEDAQKTKSLDKDNETILSIQCVNIFKKAYYDIEKDVYLPTFTQNTEYIKSKLAPNLAEKENPDKFIKTIKDMYTFNINGKDVNILTLIPKEELKEIFDSIKCDKEVKSQIDMLVKNNKNRKAKDAIEEMRFVKQDKGNDAFNIYMQKKVDKYKR